MSIFIVSVTAVVLFLTWRLLVAYVRHDVFGPRARPGSNLVDDVPRIRPVYYPPQGTVRPAA